MNFAVPHTIEELQLIVNALSARPFAEVHALISKIQNHVDSEIAKTKEAAAQVINDIKTEASEVVEEVKDAV